MQKAKSRSSETRNMREKFCQASVARRLWSGLRSVSNRLRAGCKANAMAMHVNPVATKRVIKVAHHLLPLLARRSRILAEKGVELDYTVTPEQASILASR